MNLETAQKKKADKESDRSFIKKFTTTFISTRFRTKPLLALDPGLLPAVKLVCLDDKGALLTETVIYPHPPQNKSRDAEDIVKGLMYKYTYTPLP